MTFLQDHMWAFLIPGSIVYIVIGMYVSTFWAVKEQLARKKCVRHEYNFECAEVDSDFLWICMNCNQPTGWYKGFRHTSIFIWPITLWLLGMSYVMRYVVYYILKFFYYSVLNPIFCMISLPFTLVKDMQERAIEEAVKKKEGES